MSDPNAAAVGGAPPPDVEWSDDEDESDVPTPPSYPSDTSDCSDPTPPGSEAGDFDDMGNGGANALYTSAPNGADGSAAGTGGADSDSDNHVSGARGLRSAGDGPTQPLTSDTPIHTAIKIPDDRSAVVTLRRTLSAGTVAATGDARVIPPSTAVEDAEDALCDAIGSVRTLVRRLPACPATPTAAPPTLRMQVATALAAHAAAASDLGSLVSQYAAMYSAVGLPVPPTSSDPLHRKLQRHAAALDELYGATCAVADAFGVPADAHEAAGPTRGAESADADDFSQCDVFTSRCAVVAPHDIGALRLGAHLQTAWAALYAADQAGSLHDAIAAVQLADDIVTGVRGDASAIGDGALRADAYGEAASVARAVARTRIAIEAARDDANVRFPRLPACAREGGAAAAAATKKRKAKKDKDGAKAAKEGGRDAGEGDKVEKDGAARTKEKKARGGDAHDARARAPVDVCLDAPARVTPWNPDAHPVLGECDALPLLGERQVAIVEGPAILRTVSTMYGVVGHPATGDDAPFAAMAQAVFDRSSHPCAVAWAVYRRTSHRSDARWDSVAYMRSDCPAWLDVQRQRHGQRVADRMAWHVDGSDEVLLQREGQATATQSGLASMTLATELRDLRAGDVVVLHTAAVTCVIGDAECRRIHVAVARRDVLASHAHNAVISGETVCAAREAVGGRFPDRVLDRQPVVQLLQLLPEHVLGLVALLGLRPDDADCVGLGAVQVCIDDNTTPLSREYALLRVDGDAVGVAPCFVGKWADRLGEGRTSNFSLRPTRVGAPLLPLRRDVWLEVPHVSVGAFSDFVFSAEPYKGATATHIALPSAARPSAFGTAVMQASGLSPWLLVAPTAEVIFLIDPPEARWSPAELRAMRHCVRMALGALPATAAVNGMVPHGSLSRTQERSFSKALFVRPASVSVDDKDAVCEVYMELCKLLEAAGDAQAVGYALEECTSVPLDRVANAQRHVILIGGRTDVSLTTALKRVAGSYLSSVGLLSVHTLTVGVHAAHAEYSKAAHISGGTGIFAETVAEVATAMGVVLGRILSPRSTSIGGQLKVHAPSTGTARDEAPFYLPVAFLPKSQSDATTAAAEDVARTKAPSRKGEKKPKKIHENLVFALPPQLIGTAPPALFLCPPGLLVDGKVPTGVSVKSLRIVARPPDDKKGVRYDAKVPWSSREDPKVPSKRSKRALAFRPRGAAEANCGAPVNHSPLYTLACARRLQVLTCYAGWMRNPPPPRKPFAPAMMEAIAEEAEQIGAACGLPSFTNQMIMVGRAAEGRSVYAPVLIHYSGYQYPSALFSAQTSGWAAIPEDLPRIVQCRQPDPAEALLCVPPDPPGVPFAASGGMIDQLDEWAEHQLPSGAFPPRQELIDLVAKVPLRHPRRGTPTTTNMTIDMALRLMHFGPDTQCLWASTFIKALRYLDRKGASVDLSSAIAKELPASERQ